MPAIAPGSWRSFHGWSAIAAGANCARPAPSWRPDPAARARTTTWRARSLPTYPSRPIAGAQTAHSSRGGELDALPIAGPEHGLGARPVHQVEAHGLGAVRAGPDHPHPR